jgi:hypothetical protein
MQWLLKALQFTSLMSPEIKVAIKKSVDDLAAHAKTTPGDVDDVAIGFLKTALIILGLY